MPYKIIFKTISSNKSPIISNVPILSLDNYRRHISTNQITELEPYTEHYTDMTCDKFQCLV